MQPAALADESFEKLFLREGQVLASFDHPNIVRIYDNDRVGDSAYLVMEHLPGGTLAERMRRAPITIGETLGLVVQIASDAANLTKYTGLNVMQFVGGMDFDKQLKSATSHAFANRSSDVC